MDTLAPAALVQKSLRLNNKARCWPSPQDGDRSFILKWQEGGKKKKRLEGKEWAGDGARNDSSETDVRTHHIPTEERTLKTRASFLLSLLIPAALNLLSISREWTLTKGREKCKFFLCSWSLGWIWEQHGGGVMRRWYVQALLHSPFHQWVEYWRDKYSRRWE